jgi:CheY-like chemotaxis protein
MGEASRRKPLGGSAIGLPAYIESSRLFSFIGGEVTPMCTVLVVDDDAQIREAIGHSLRFSGHETEGAANGHEALEWLEAHSEKPPCMIILDLKMPVMGGWDFLDNIRKEPAWTDLPVIVLSASVRQGPPHHLLKALAFWPKPIDPQRLEYIHEHCPLHERSWQPEVEDAVEAD